eukprot:13873815-Ditylum_brightwellii.AAC.1
MAKLIFDGTKIEYLEEYAQGMDGSSVKWPGIESSDEELWNKIRFETPSATTDMTTNNAIVCDLCQTVFTSRTKLFAHLKSTIPVSDTDDDDVATNNNSQGKKTRCIPNTQSNDTTILVCLSVSYAWINDPEECMIRAIQDVITTRNNKKSSCNEQHKQVNLHNPPITMTWAVPPKNISTTVAIVNVVTIKLSMTLLFGMEQLTTTKVDVEFIEVLLPKLLNETLKRLIVSSSSTSNQKTENNNAGKVMKMMRIHTAGIVNRPCAPERREFEKYAVIIPWEKLGGKKKQSETVFLDGEEEGNSGGNQVYTEEEEKKKNQCTAKTTS